MVAVPTWSWPGLSRLVPAIPIIGHCAILIEIAGTSLDKPGDDATSFAPVTRKFSKLLPLLEKLLAVVRTAGHRLWHPNVLYLLEKSACWNDKIRGGE